MKRICIRFIRWYQAVSRALIAQQFPLLAMSGCRSWPTCSEYSIEAISHYGVIRGGAKSIVRIMRCNPLTRKH